MKPAALLPETIQAEAFQRSLLAKRLVGARAPLRSVFQWQAVATFYYNLYNVLLPILSKCSEFPGRARNNSFRAILNALI
ncbi:MAG TPA: hypothetical protein VFN23_17990, partial [Ktedonobacteraceae bacterium]|nr:hypothetical protein [Ktedonobacteraceae bacterium]